MPIFISLNVHFFHSGLKTAIALEELGLPHENHIINIMKGEQFAPDFLKVSPNNKIPAIVDPNGPGAFGDSRPTRGSLPSVCACF